MPKLSLEERATLGVRGLSQRKKFTMKELAERASQKPGQNVPTTSIHRVIHGTQPVSLRILEAACELAQVNPLELLVDSSEHELKMVTPDEAQMLRYFRSWPAATRLALLTFLSVFADEEPALYAERVAHEQIRRLKPESVKRRAYAYLTFLSEGGLTPDLQEAFGLLETDAPPAPKLLPPKKGRRPKTS